MSDIPGQWEDTYIYGRFVYNHRPGTSDDNSNAFSMTKMAAIARVE
jgi:hypothetical protein